MDDVKSAGIGSTYTLIIKNDNSFWVIGLTSNPTAAVKVADNVKFVDTDEITGNFIKADNSLWGFGLVNINGINSSSETPVKIEDNVAAYAAGYVFGLIVKTDDTIWAAGENGAGQLGDGTNVFKNSFVKIKLP